ncbi:MAG: DNA polymerase III subunit gamma/tau [Clostridia bacterium]|nr:DNA polymerase III subunit gamma/tau [Clostridia bacterium]
MYRVLYRKWRPQTFNDVAGQPHITDTLMNEVRENRLAHAYLFTGSRGTGKTSCAKILSKAINCLHPTNGNPCNECDICKGIDNGSVLDVVEIDAASNRGIDDIRALREESAFTPAQAKFRVYIIDEVHMLTIEAFNALLKTLEEPPEHIVFILATTEVQKLPSTILSRCQRFDFRRISVDSIVKRLKYVAEKENVSIDDSAAMLIARIADGGMRDALSIFDRCLSISENVNTAVVSDAAGIMSKDYLFTLSYAFKNKDTSKALSVIDELHNSSCDTERLCTELTNHFRSLLIIKSVKRPEDILIGTNEELEELKRLSSQFSIEEILNIMNILSSAIASIKVTQNRRIETEMAIIKICSPEASTDISALFSRIAELEDKINKLSSGQVVINTAATENTSDDKKTDVFPVIPEIKNTETKNAVDLNSLEFEDDSDEYDDFDLYDVPPPPSDAPIFENEPFFDDPPFDIEQTTDNPVMFDAEPTTDTLQFDDEPVFDAPPVFDDEPVETSPVFDAQPAPQTQTSGNITRIWTNCIIEAERECPPVTGHLLGTKAEINGNILTVYNYNSVLPMIFPIVKDKLTQVARKITGNNELTVRLG